MTDDRDTAFTKEQFALSYPDGIHRHWWQVARNYVILTTLRQVATPSTPVIEVGCGRGVVVKYLRDCGQRCCGVELADAEPYPGVAGAVRFGLYAEDLPAEERSEIEVLLLLDVIEHCPDPESFLRDLSLAFPALRHVLLTVPGRPEAWSSYDEVFGHYRRYSLPMIDQLASALGWRVRRARYFFHLLYLVARALTHFVGERPVQIHAPSVGPVSWLNRCLGCLQIVEQRIVPGRIAGLSIVAVLEIGPPADRSAAFGRRNSGR